MLLLIFFSGKWCHVERMFVPEEYMQTLLTDMTNALVNSARKKKHLCPPVWSGGKHQEFFITEIMK